MSTLDHIFDLPEQICYVQCGFCTTILMVSVPFRSLSMVVTVRCGHCMSLLSVNMMKASFLPLHLLASLSQHEICPQSKEASPEEGAKKSQNMTSADCEEEDAIPIINVTNKPPEKRQRAPSAYNCFIKEEIRRLKAENPDMSHKEAFSTAAKNWANCPPIQMEGGKERCIQRDEETDSWQSSVAEVDEEQKGFRERKVPRNSMVARTPFK